MLRILALTLLAKQADAWRSYATCDLAYNITNDTDNLAYNANTSQAHDLSNSHPYYQSATRAVEKYLHPRSTDSFRTGHQGLYYSGSSKNPHHIDDYVLWVNCTEPTTTTTTTPAPTTAAATTASSSNNTSNATGKPTAKTGLMGVNVGMGGSFGAKTTADTACATGGGWKGNVYSAKMQETLVNSVATVLSTNFDETTDRGVCKADGSLKSGKYCITRGQTTCGGGLVCGCETYHPMFGSKFECVTGTQCTTMQTALTTMGDALTANGRRALRSSALRELQSNEITVETSAGMKVKKGATTKGGSAIVASTFNSAVKAAVPAKAAFQASVQKAIREMSTSDLNAMKPQNGNTMTVADMQSAAANVTVAITKAPADSIVIDTGSSSGATSTVLSAAAVAAALMI